MASEPQTTSQHTLLRTQLAKVSRRTPRLINPSAKSADIELRFPGSFTTAGSPEQQLDRTQERELRVVEFDSSRVLQPFLDGEKVLQGLRDLRKGKIQDLARSR